MRTALLSALLFVSAALFGQAKFYASAPKSTPVNQNFQLNFTLENANGNGLKAPSFNDFQLLSGPNTSTSMQWVNGNVSQSVTYSYILRPKKEGQYKIGKAAISVGGVNMESNELTIDVTAPVAQPQAQQRQRNPFDPFDDPFFQQGEPEPQVSNGDLSKQLKDDVFIKLTLTKSSVYKGELLSASYKLYFRQNLSGFNVTKAPAFDGFWSQEVELDPKRRPAVENVNGKQYNTIEILKYNLYPQRAGVLKIPPVEVNTVAQVMVRSKSRSVFDDFFNMGRAQQVPLTLKADGSTVQVKDLPEQGKPADFAGAVGSFKFETSLSSKTAKTDEPITYTIKISGTGNLKMLDVPTLTLPPAFEVYEPKTKENFTNGATGLNGIRQDDYLIIPRQPGDYTIDAKTFSYFDPSAGKYFTIKSPEYSVKVTGEPSKNINANAGTGRKEDVSLLSQDIRYIKTNTPVFDKEDNSFFGSGTFTAAYSAPLLLFLGMIAVRRRNETLAADVVGTKRRRAIKLAKKRLSVASKYLAANEQKLFYDEVSRGIWGYLTDKLNMDMAQLSKESVEERLALKSVKAETSAKLFSVLHACEIALYAPGDPQSEMQKNYETALNLIADLEDEIKS